jgi:hypothetical protein
MGHTAKTMTSLFWGMTAASIDSVKANTHSAQEHEVDFQMATQTESPSALMSRYTTLI